MDTTTLVVATYIQNTTHESIPTDVIVIAEPINLV
jgi:hypothetical protein